MRNYKPLKKIIMILAVLIVLVLSIFIFILFSIKSKNENISKLKNDLAQHSNENQYLGSMQNMVNTANTSINQVNSSILKSDGDVFIIETIEQLAKKNGLDVTIDSLAVEDLASLKDSGMTTLRIKAKTAGAWAPMYNFISELTAMPYKIRVEGFSLISNTDGVTSTVKKGIVQWQSVFEIRLLKYK